MSFALLALLCLQAVVFAAFIILAFRWLFAIRGEAVSHSGRTLPGPAQTLAAFRIGLTAPHYARLRFGLIVSGLFLLGTAPLIAILHQ